MSEVTPAVELEGFSFEMGSRRILEDITLSIHEGERVSVIGPNGSGKTTLLRCLVRINTPGTGAIRVCGRPVEGYDRRALARKVSYVPQAQGFFVPFTVREFLVMGRHSHLGAFAGPGRKDLEVIEWALSITGTLDLADRRITTLSGGEAQRVFIASSLAQQAGIMLLDEPTSFLDPGHQSDIHRILGRINREHGVTMVLVTHDLTYALQSSDRVLALKRGKVFYWGGPEGLVSGGVLESIYDNPFLILKHPMHERPIVIAEHA
jgi:iron complex transport system ATP-binding protein